MTADPIAHVKPGEIVFSENVQADRYKALLDRLNTRPEQGMSAATFDEICRRSWEALPNSTPWDNVGKFWRESHAADVRNALTAAADLMPIETLHGADGASLWLRGEG